MGELTRDDIRTSAKRLKMKRIETPGWGDGHVHVRALRATQARDVQELARQQEEGTVDDISGLARWCIMGVCDAKGNPLFTTDDLPMLLDGPLVPVQDCALAIMELNNLAVQRDGRQEKKSVRSRRTVRVPTRKGAGRGRRR